MPSIKDISPAIAGMLNDNGFTAQKVLRYGPRYVCLVATDAAGQIGMFKAVLPKGERENLQSGQELSERLNKEADFLRHFHQHIGQGGFEPRLISYASAPSWSFRTYITSASMAVGNSDFRFDTRFFDEFSPAQVVDFFLELQKLSDDLPDNLNEYIKNYISTLTIPSRFDRFGAKLREIPELAQYAIKAQTRLHEAIPRFAEYKKSLNQYEPYACHIFSVNGRMSMIDWENVGWGHHLRDLSVLWMRCFERPDWQAEYIEVMRDRGLLDGNGQLYWDTEIMLQSMANLGYFNEQGPIGTPEYDELAKRFFIDTTKNVLARSDFFA